MTSLTSSHFSTSGTFTCPSARHLPVSLCESQWRVLWWGGGRHYNRPLATCWKSRTKLLPAEFNSPQHINYQSQPIHWTHRCRSKQETLQAKAAFVNCWSHQLCGGDFSAVWAACFRRSWPSYWPPQAGCWCLPPCQRTTGRCHHLMGQSSPQLLTGPICGRLVSPIQQECPTAKTFPRC